MDDLTVSFRMRRRRLGIQKHLVKDRVTLEELWSKWLKPFRLKGELDIKSLRSKKIAFKDTR